eukprot:6770658-Karenia_brevis.AAC.1
MMRVRFKTSNTLARRKCRWIYTYIYKYRSTKRPQTGAVKVLGPYAPLTPLAPLATLDLGAMAHLGQVAQGARVAQVGRMAQ